MAGNRRILLERAGMAVNGNIQLELPGNGCKLLERCELREMIKFTGNNITLLEIPGNGWIGWIWLNMA